MNIIAINQLEPRHKEAVYRLWNNEYPQQLQYTSMEGLETYLANLTNQQHYFSVNDDNVIMGWAFTFERENEHWFAVIVDSQMQRSGAGTALLNRLKADNRLLNGWVTDHYRYRKSNGAIYLSPMQFYLKSGFEVCSEIRLEFEKLSAVKIKWEEIN